MTSPPSLAQRLGRVLERVTRQSGRLAGTPAYGSLILGRVSESPGRRRVRIQTLVTVSLLTVNVIGVLVAALLVSVAYPVPSVFTDVPAWLTFGVAPAYAAAALAFGSWWITTRTVRDLRWAAEGRAPTRIDQRNGDGNSANVHQSGNGAHYALIDQNGSANQLDLGQSGLGAQVALLRQTELPAEVSVGTP